MTTSVSLQPSWTLTVDDLPYLGTGAGILGTGGGGSPRLGRLRIRNLLEADDYPDEVDVVDLSDLPDDATVVGVGGMGAPTVSDEKPLGGDEDLRSLRAIEQAADVDVDAIIGFEIGGTNSMAPFAVGALAGLPVVDADGMGRAFPELQMTTFYIYGAAPEYAALTDERGNQVVYRDIDSPKRLENLARANTIELGGRTGVAFPLMDGRLTRESALPGTVSLAIEAGRAVHDARQSATDPVDAVCDVTDGRKLFEGKVTDVLRRTTEGFARGRIDLAELAGDRSFVIEFQNEFLVARDNAGDTLASVPDLICLVDRDTAEPIPSSQVKYGQRLAVLGIPAPEKLRTDRALSVVGPEAFGYDEPYDPLERE